MQNWKNSIATWKNGFGYKSFVGEKRPSKKEKSSFIVHKIIELFPETAHYLEVNASIAANSVFKNAIVKIQSN